MAQRVDAEHDQRHPDEAESDELRERHVFVPDARRRRGTAAPASGTAAARSPTAAAAASRQRTAAAARPSRCRSTRSAARCPCHGAENQVALRCQHDQRDHRGDEQRARLDGQRIERTHGRPASSRSRTCRTTRPGSVRSRAGGRSRSRSRRRLPSRSRRPSIGRRAAARRARDAEQDREQRIDEVAEAALDHVSRVHAPDVDSPVDRDEDGGGGQQCEAALVPQHRAVHRRTRARARAARPPTTSDQAIRDARISTVPAGSSSGK